MNKLNLPPFYVGQKVVAIKNHPRNLFKAGDVFTILNIQPPVCGCNIWIVDVGFKAAKHGGVMVCPCCNKLVPDFTDIAWTRHTNFAEPKQQNFSLIKLSKIMEKEKEEILIEN